MALNDNLFGMSQGKIGNLVFYKRNGTGIVRTRPAHFKDKKSPRQLAQRQRMQVANSFLKSFHQLIRITWAAEAGDRSVWHVVYRHIVLDALAGEYPEIFVDKKKALLSKGSLPLPENAWVEPHQEGLHITWENGLEAKGNAARDTLVVVAYNEKTGSSDFRFSEASRADGGYIWKPGIKFTEDALPDVWIAFRNKEQSQVSDSLYLGH